MSMTEQYMNIPSYEPLMHYLVTKQIPGDNLIH